MKNRQDEEEKSLVKTMKIENMMCGHCEKWVRTALEKLEEVDEAVVSHVEGTAIVTLNSDVDNEVLKNVVEKQGYPVIEII